VVTLERILDGLIGPRENGDAALGGAAAYLESALKESGAEVTLHEFLCRPYNGRLAGAVCLVLAVGFFALMWRRRFAGGLLVALLLPAYLLVDFQLRLPLVSRIGSVTAHNVVARFPVPNPERLVILGAHYDTKTDLLDHYDRAPIQFLIAPVLVFTILLPITGWWRRSRRRPERHIRFWAALVPIYFVPFFLTLTGGAFVSQRSPGALDDGGAVAVLVRLAEMLGQGKPGLERTEVRIVLFAGEEVGLQGSERYVAERLSSERQPTYFINGEAWGFGREMAYFTDDRTALRRYGASTALVRTLDRAYRRVSHGVGLAPDPQPVTTDAQSFMRADIPSVTLGSHRDGEYRVRELHSAGDARERLQIDALRHALRFLQEALVEIDVRGVHLELR
jgi:acetylornithine deacetylase/succinyl-diaminopimelate desuccinylase-like protein